MELGCLTMTNIKCRGGKEIDLLAMNPLSGQRYHIESTISTTFKLRDKATYRKDGRCHKNGLDYFYKEKFQHPEILSSIKKILGNADYRKVLVVWNAESEVSENAKKQYRIDVMFLGRIIRELLREQTTSGSRDDVLRVLELTSRLTAPIRFRKDSIHENSIKEETLIASYHLRSKCKNCGHWNRFKVHKAGRNIHSREPRIHILSADLIPLKEKKCSKCGSLIASQKELKEMVITEDAKKQEVILNDDETWNEV